MGKSLSLLRNKVARRILISFVLAALIPIGILGLLSFQQVSRQLHDQTATSLHKSCRDYSLRLLDRLTLVESALRMVARRVEKSDKGFHLNTLERQQSLVGQFDSLTVVAQDGEKTSLLGKDNFIPDLTVLEMQEIGSGITRIKSNSGLKPASGRIWMAINLIEARPEAGILMAELKPGPIWEAEDFEPNTLWVMDQTQQLLFVSDPDVGLPPEAKMGFLKAHSGQFTWKNGDDTYVGEYRRIAMESFFFAPDMIVVLAQPEKFAYAAIAQFSAIYPPVIVLAVLIVALLSAQLIKKYLTPLERLKAATLRIAEGDFSSRVNINSHDEFEALADSFNEMTRRLRSQFDILSTMAEIDRHILSALDAEEIVNIALSRLPDVLYCDLISIAKVDPGTYQVSDIHTRRTGHDTDIMAKPIELSQDDILSLLERQGSLIETNVNGKLSAYLKAFRGVDDWTFLIVPVVVNGTLSSIICLGYQGHNPIPPESRDAVRNFGDRIAVALSNAAWEEKLYRQAHYDPLTGLPNRLVLNDRLMQELARAKRDHTQLAVLFIDLDRFKTVNDSLGHAAGDELLTQVSRIFVNCVRETDLVVRIGGDEFVIVITDLHNHHNPMSMVSSIAEKILAALNHTLVVAGHAMTFTASLGVAIFPRDADNPQDLLKNADAAMYHAKDEGRANFRFYSPELNAAALENIKLEQELRGAIAREELRVYYQPKVDLSRRIVGAEALIRWQHVELGFISPAKFIPLAEHTGLIVEIGQWVFEQTCLWVKACHAKGFRPIRVSVNLSGIEFKRPDLVDKIAEILSKTGVDPQFIELELTESVAIGNIKDSVERMHKLKALGLSLSMDDFGTGFSSLSYLKELPLDIIKIDQSFVRHLELEKSSQAIVKSILALAHGLSMETVAEGVENEAQLDFLEQNQCQVFQGFLFSRPIPGEDFLKLLVEGPVKEEPSKA